MNYSKFYLIIGCFSQFQVNLVTICIYSQNYILKNVIEPYQYTDSKMYQLILTKFYNSKIVIENNKTY